LQSKLKETLIKLIIGRFALRLAAKSEPDRGSDRLKIQRKSTWIRSDEPQKQEAVFNIPRVASLAGRYRDPVLIFSTHFEVICEQPCDQKFL
jgi:hypothetical protein